MGGIVTVSILLLIQVWIFRCLSYLRKEVNVLRGQKMLIEINHPAIGMNIDELLKVKEIPSEKQGIFIFTLPHCSACYSQIEQTLVLRESNDQIPVCVVLPEEEEFLKQEFLTKYEELLKIRFTTFEILNGNLDFPSILTVNKKGVVTNVYKNIEYAYEFYSEKEGLLND